MKLNGFVGKGSGKLGSSVFAISGGEQIVREYNPRVANPNTDAQVEQRAKLKLMSQLAAALAPGLGFKKMGLVSARNQFVAKNIVLCAYENEKAECDLDLLQLADGNIMLPNLTVTPNAGGSIAVALSSAAQSNVKAVAYVLVERGVSEKIILSAVKIVERDENGVFSTTITGKSDAEYVIYAYGVIPTSSNNSISYGDYIAANGETTAMLEVMNILRAAGNTFTKTNGEAFENTPV